MKKEREIKKKDILNIEVLPSRIQHPYEITKNYVFSIHETRIFSRILQRLKIHQTMDKKLNQDLFNTVQLTFNIKDLTIGNDYVEIKKALENLREKSVTINTIVSNGERGFLSSGLINAYSYAFNNSVVDIKLHYEWYTYLLTGLDKGYTSYLSQTSFEMSNEYFYNMYLYISHWHKTYEMEGKRFTIEQLRKVFKLPNDVHIRSANFIRYVIKPCKAILDKVADKSFNFELIRKVEGATRGKGAEIIAIDLKYYNTNFQVKKEVNTNYDSKRADKFIQFCGRLYKLIDLDKARLGAISKKYGQDWIGAIEKEERKFLKKQPDFIDGIVKLVHSRIKG